MQQTLFTQHDADMQAKLAAARNAARISAPTLELRKEFHARNLFTPALEEQYGIIANVPVSEIANAVLASRAEDAAAKARIEAAASSVAAPVVDDELPPSPEEHDDAQALDKKTRLDALAKTALLEIAARKNSAQCTIVSLPPTRAPTVPLEPGADECWCTNKRCRTRHVIALDDAFVPEDSVLTEMFGDENAPTFAQLLTVASCRGVFRDNTGHRWYRILETRDRIRHFTAASARPKAAPAQAERPAVKAKQNARGEKSLSLDQIGGWKSLRAALGK